VILTQNHLHHNTLPVKIIDYFVNRICSKMIKTLNFQYNINCIFFNSIITIIFYLLSLFIIHTLQFFNESKKWFFTYNSDRMEYFFFSGATIITNLSLIYNTIIVSFLASIKVFIYEKCFIYYCLIIINNHAFQFCPFRTQVFRPKKADVSCLLMVGVDQQLLKTDDIFTNTLTIK
jgi:hypothetical protein